MFSDMAIICMYDMLLWYYDIMIMAYSGTWDRVIPLCLSLFSFTSQSSNHKIILQPLFTRTVHSLLSQGKDYYVYCDSSLFVSVFSLFLSTEKEGKLQVAAINVGLQLLVTFMNDS